MDALVELGLPVPRITPDAFRARADAIVALAEAADTAASDVHAATRTVLDGNASPTADAFAAYAARPDGSAAKLGQLAADARIVANSYFEAAEATSRALSEIDALDARYAAKLDALAGSDAATRARWCAALLPAARQELARIEEAAVEAIHRALGPYAEHAVAAPSLEVRWRSIVDDAPARAAEIVVMAAEREARQLGVPDTAVKVTALDARAGYDWERGTILVAPDTLEHPSALDALRHELHHARHGEPITGFPTWQPGAEASRWLDARAGVPPLPVQGRA